jgi:predicted phage baseplate assembly protein
MNGPPDSIVLHAGTQARMRADLLASLSGAQRPALRGLTVRSNDDFTIALLDAWATIADVLTFYQERIANEAYLGTCVERLSVIELARLIGYQPRAGVAAETFLAFTLETAVGAPRALTLDIGARAQSQPGPDEKPQTFETVEPIETRPAWNALTPRQRVPQAVTVNADSYTILSGTLVQPGDVLLVRVGSAWAVPLVRRVTASADGRTARLDVASGATGTGTLTELSTGAFATPFTDAAPLSASTLQNRVLGRKWHQADLVALAATQQWPLDRLTRALEGQLAIRPRTTGGELFVLRQRAALFGHNAPQHASLPGVLRFTSHHETSIPTATNKIFATLAPAFGSSWENRTAADDSGSPPSIDLDSIYSGIAPGSWVVLRLGTAERAYQVLAVSEVARAAYTLSARVTRLTLSSATDLNLFRLRGTTVLLHSEPLALADVPPATPVGGSNIQLDAPYLELRAGQRLAVTGPRADLPGASGAEVRTIIDAVLDDGRTVLILDRALDHTYVRGDPEPARRVRLNANVARATHGETVSEVLGGGDARVPFQKLALRQAPLTLVSAPTPSGTESTLELRVDGVLWNEVSTLVGQDASARVYVTRTDDDGKTTVQFGDGASGARPPSGIDNVQAKYRKGIGTAALLGPDRISTLLTRPLGLREVTNPVAAMGGDDPESRDAARRNAPLTVLTLGRIVSLQDYADFARAFAGIAKAHATWMAVGSERGVLLTVCGADGEDVAAGTTLETNLLAAMRKAGDPTVPVRLLNRNRVWFRLQARIRTAAELVRSTVLAQVEQRLRARFGFDARDFGQNVTLAEVTTTMHEVAGVIGIDVDALYREDEQSAAPHPLVPAHVPAAGTTLATAAELLLLDPRPLAFSELT